MGEYSLTAPFSLYSLIQKYKSVSMHLLGVSFYSYLFAGCGLEAVRTSQNIFE